LIAVDIAPGTILLGKYRVDASLGLGGFGHVVRARHLLADQSVAIKILRDDVDIDEENQARFLREAQAMVRLKSEHVAKISDVGHLESGAPYVVMELLEGMDLGKLLESAGRLPALVAVDLVLQACDVLAEAHALGIVHRDLKPTNLFVTKRADGSQSIKVLDFGISKAPTTEEMKLTQTATMLGTPAYMSPEQMRSARQVDARSDIWSLGILLYELVEGHLPYFAESFAELAVRVATEPFERMVAAPELAPVIARCLGKTPKDRYQSVAELAADIARFATPDTARTYVARIHRVLGRAVPNLYESSPSLPVRAQSVPAVQRNRIWIVVIVGGAVLGVILTLAFALGGSPEQPAPKESPIVRPAPPPEPAPAPPAAAVEPVVEPPPAPTPPPPAAPKKPATPTAVKKPATPTPPPPPPQKPKCDVYSSYGGKC
jgi:serine/threonine-protein kinase